MVMEVTNEGIIFKDLKEGEVPEANEVYTRLVKSLAAVIYENCNNNREIAYGAVEQARVYMIDAINENIESDIPGPMKRSRRVNKERKSIFKVVK